MTGYLLQGGKSKPNITFSSAELDIADFHREPMMESFVHLRKGRTPGRLHAGLDGLKDDELAAAASPGAWRTCTDATTPPPIGARARCGRSMCSVASSSPVTPLTRPADRCCCSAIPIVGFGHPDKEMHEIPGATHYCAGPDQRDALHQAVNTITDWLVRHDFMSPA